MRCTEKSCRYLGPYGSCNTYDGQCVVPFIPQRKETAKVAETSQPEPISAAAAGDVPAPAPAASTKKKGLRGALNDLLKGQGD